MPNSTIPAAAEGVSNQVGTLLLEGIDQLGAVRCAIELASYALDSMGSDREVMHSIMASIRLTKSC